MDSTNRPAAADEAGPTAVFVAGIGNSGPEHWQRRWHERIPGSVWVEHDSWDEPVRDTWVGELQAALRAVEGPKILIAHSLGCPLVVEWASEHQPDGVVGAFLVAVPDVHGPNFPSEATGFDSPRYRALPFPALVVASTDDPYGSPEHSREITRCLGAGLVDVGPKGHLNAASGLGDWAEGWELFGGLLDERDARRTG
jgi:predicted alpha/beta hydrolase family esterase